MTNFLDLGFDKFFKKGSFGKEGSNGGQIITVPDNSVTEEKIQDEAVTSQKIKDFNWSSGKGGVALFGGQNNVGGTVRAKNDSGEEVLLISKDGLGLNEDCVYRYTISPDHIIDSDTPHLVLTASIQTKIPTILIASLTAQLDSETWDASNYCSLWVALSGGPSTELSTVSAGNTGNANTYNDLKTTVSTTLMVYSNTKSGSIYQKNFTVKVYRGGTVGNPTGYLRNCRLNFASIGSPMTINTYL